MPDGYIKLHRSMLEWEWYTDQVTCRVFLHLLLNATYKPMKWRGMDIEAGQVITGLDKLSSELGLSVRSVRTALLHLKTTGELTNKTTNKGSVITLVNWSKYQARDDAIDKQNDNASDSTLTEQRQDNDKTTTTIKEYKEGEECKEGKENKELVSEGKPTHTKRFFPPSLEEVKAYCLERGNTVDPDKFFAYYASNGWRVGKNPMKNWQQAIVTWERNDRTNVNARSDASHQGEGHGSATQNVWGIKQFEL